MFTQIIVNIWLSFFFLNVASDRQDMFNCLE